MKFNKILGVVLDMDGVLWRGDQPLPGFHDIFAYLHERSIPYALLTNNSGKTPTQYVEKLARLGVPDVPAARILTSASATAAYLSGQYPAGTRVYVIGMDGIREALDAAGFDVVGEDGPAEVVVAGIDFALSYPKLRRAALLIRAGAAFIGTNGDKTFPTPDGLVPGAGSILALLRTATDIEPTVIGKPALPMFEAALRVTGTPAAQTLMIGDRLDTDISGAQQAGLATALLLSGVANPEDPMQSGIWPDVAFEHLEALLRAWAGDAWVQARSKARRRAGS
jgi:4-nitrophenyl phosphatase